MTGRATAAARWEADAFVDHALVAFRIDEPDAFVLGVAEVDLAALVEYDVVRVHIIGDY
jgi:hypothetical protein